MSIPHGRFFPSDHAFLKLQPPQIMSKDELGPPEEKSVEWLKYWLYRTSDHRFIPDPRLVDYVAEYKRCQRKEGLPHKSQKEFMGILFPTRYWTERGVRYKQKVSQEQVTRQDLVEMAGKLNELQEYRQSQLTSKYCPIRFGLHLELFDELIRQVALYDSMRAYMLDRVRGELLLTLDSYKAVFEVSLVEESKAQAEQKIDPEIMHFNQKLDEAQEELASVLEENESVHSDLKEVESKYELMERIESQVYEPEILFLQQLGEALERQIWHFENPPTYDTGEEEEAEAKPSIAPPVAAATTATAPTVAATAAPTVTAPAAS